MMNVLSLFDGISCGRVALERADIEVNNYYSSEIDKYATTVSSRNYPTNIPLGDVTNWKCWDIDWKNIDLVFAGFPCQAWSVAGNQKGDKDKRGQLFWVMLDILKRVKKKNPNFTYLIENVRMKLDFETYITNALSKVLPSINKYLINSALVSAQLRKRFYWTNIENVEQPKDRNIILSDILEDGAADQLKSYCIDASYYKGTDLKQYLSKKRRQVAFKSTKRIHQIRNSIGYRIYSTQGKAACLAASGGGLAGGGGSLIYDKNWVRKLTPLECERLQTLPDNYTAGISNSQRYKCIGNGWTVEVVRHILETWKKNINLIK